jgi:DtxR family Mn-dependent transcriptional regulator
METAHVLTALSETMQMYIKRVHEIETIKGAARVTDIAAALDVKKASVTSALRNLSARGLVNYAPYDVVTLTEDGRQVAEELGRRYTALRDFFINVLGIDPDTAEKDACSLEHHLSETLYKRLISFIQCYQTCTRKNSSECLLKEFLDYYGAPGH